MLQAFDFIAKPAVQVSHFWKSLKFFCDLLTLSLETLSLL